MKFITKHFDRQQRSEILRFIIVGTVATALQYTLYVLFCQWLHPTIANTIAYALSFLFNFFASAHYTFKVKSTLKRGMGFATAHLTNYCLQTILLTIFLYIGIPKLYALLPVFAVCVPVNFLLVRFFMKGRQNTKEQTAQNPKTL